MIEITKANRHALQHCALTYVACVVFTYYIYYIYIYALKMDRNVG